MVMVDRVIRSEGSQTVTAFLIRPDNVFLENGKLAEAGLIENMAQTAAAGTGASPEESGKEPRTGFIGGIKDLTINKLPCTGEEIVTLAVVEHSVLDAKVVRAEVRLNEKVIAGCEIKIFLI